ncbi:MAG: response regulator transcription factor [Pseudomonadota bacterium]
MTKMLIADDHAVVRDGIRAQLHKLDKQITTIDARNWLEALDAAVKHPELELAMVDLRMPGGEGCASLAQLLRINPGLPVLVLSASEDVSDMRESLRLGAMGYATKGESSTVLMNAIRLVLEGGVYIPPALVGRGHDAQSASPLIDPTCGLTARQLDVLRLIAEGKSNKEIAQILQLARATVKVHLAAIFRALNVENRTQAAIIAERFGVHRSAAAD